MSGTDCVHYALDNTTISSYSATSLRMMVIKEAHDREQGNRIIPNNSIDCLFTILKQIQADKRRTANAWVTRTITKKQRDMLALLGLEPKLPETSSGRS